VVQTLERGLSCVLVGPPLGGGGQIEIVGVEKPVLNVFLYVLFPVLHLFLVLLFDRTEWEQLHLIKSEYSGALFEPALPEIVVDASNFLPLSYYHQEMVAKNVYNAYDTADFESLKAWIISICKFYWR